MEKKRFVVRLVVPSPTFPSPTFPGDLTPPERELMQRHAASWRGLMAQGDAHVFGPVADPAGAYGLGVLEVDSEDEARALAADDPALTSGLGRTELAPMRAVLPARR